MFEIMLEALLTLGTITLTTALTVLFYRFSNMFRTWADKEMAEED